MDQGMDESTAIEKLKQGDWSGLETLVRKHQAKALRLAYLITQDKELAEDVVAETFFHLASHLNHFDQRRPFEPYLMRSVANAALKAAQAQQRHLSLDGNPAVVEAIFIQARSVESDVEALELAHQVNQALRRLSPRQRMAIIQRYYLEMNEVEMSQAMGVAPGTVKWLLNAARARLRALFDSEGRER